MAAAGTAVQPDVTIRLPDSLHGHLRRVGPSRRHGSPSRKHRVCEGSFEPLLLRVPQLPLQLLLLLLVLPTTTAAATATAATTTTTAAATATTATTTTTTTTTTITTTTTTTTIHRKQELVCIRNRSAACGSICIDMKLIAWHV